MCCTERLGHGEFPADGLAGARQWARLSVGDHFSVFEIIICDKEHTCITETFILQKAYPKILSPKTASVMLEKNESRERGGARPVQSN